jgi:hypothetical protein
MKKKNKLQKLSPEAAQKPCPAEGLKILARMISRVCMAKHMVTEPEGGTMEIREPFKKFTGTTKNDIPSCST